VPDETTMQLVYDDGWQAEIAPPDTDGTTRVSVTAPGGRQWTGTATTIDEAIHLVWRILDEQHLALAAEAQETAPPS
jgi:hypothetical protein